MDSTIQNKYQIFCSRAIQISEDARCPDYNLLMIWIVLSPGRTWEIITSNLHSHSLNMAGRGISKSWYRLEAMTERTVMSISNDYHLSCKSKIPLLDLYITVGQFSTLFFTILPSALHILYQKSFSSGLKI